jgi:hypothetical protein
MRDPLVMSIPLVLLSLIVPAQTLHLTGSMRGAVDGAGKHDRLDFRQVYYDGPLRIALMQSLKRGQPWEFSGGLDSMLLTIGPAALEGLLREVRSPLRFTADSSVFAQTTDVSLDGSISGSAVSCVFVRVLPGTLHLGLLQTRRRRTAALHIGVGSHENTSVEFLGTVGRPEAKESAGEWYLDRPADPGSPLRVVGMRLAVTPGAWRLGGTGVVSSGIRRDRGSFSHLWLRREQGVLQPAMLLGVASPDYRTPDGARCSYAWALEQRLAVVAPLRFETSGRRMVEQSSSSLRPPSHRRTVDKVTGLIEWLLLDTRATSILLRLEAAADREWNSSGDLRASGAWSTAAVLTRPRFTVQGSGGGNEEIPKGDFAATLEAGPVTTRGEISLARGSPSEVGFTVALDRKRGRLALSLDSGSQHNRTAELRLEWDYRYKPRSALAVRK